MVRTYEGWFGRFELDPEIDFYGNGYWENISNKVYEPDTMVFLEKNVDGLTEFFDIGAATGAMSIIAASLGAQVFAYEAVPRVYQIAKSHISNNLEISELIDLRNNAISDRPGLLKLGNKTDSSVLSSISNEQPAQEFEGGIRVVTLAEEIRNFHNESKKLIIKIDIEGAEWRLLSDAATLKVLRNHKALVLLAIHPGFNRPFKKIPLGLTFFSKKIWQIQNLFVAYNFFNQLLAYASLKRTNLDGIRSAKKCVLLMFGGYFEFIIDFRERQ